MNLPVILSKNAATLTKHETHQLAFDFADNLIRTSTPQEAAAELKRLQEFIAVVDLRIREELKYVEAGEYFGCKITHAKGKTTWDYSADPEWGELKEQMRMREKFLQKLDSDIEHIDDESGEVWIAARKPVRKESESSVRIELK